MKALPGHGPKVEEEVSYTDIKVIGKGTFGVVYRARLISTDELVAIKKVFHNEKYKVHCQSIYIILYGGLHRFFYSFFAVNCIVTDYFLLVQCAVTHHSHKLLSSYY